MSWIEEERGGILVMRPASSPAGVTVAFSGRGRAPAGEPAPTAYLARRLANAVGLDAAPISWAHQVHGVDAATLRESRPAASAYCAGEYDALATDQPGAAIVVQTADCVPILLLAPGVVGAAHAGEGAPAPATRS